MIVTDERIALKVNATGLIPVCGDERTVKGEIILANPYVRGRKLLSPSFGDGLGFGKILRTYRRRCWILSDRRIERSAER